MAGEIREVQGSYEIDAWGNMSLISHGGGTVIQATGMGAGMLISADCAVTMTAGTATFNIEGVEELPPKVTLFGGVAGDIEIRVGLPEVGPRITITPLSITLAVGPPGLGSSIKLSLEGITLQSMAVKHEITPKGITESVLAVSREVTLIGHNFTAAETSVKFGMEGVNVEGPLLNERFDAVVAQDAPLKSLKASGVKDETNSIAMFK